MHLPYDFVFTPTPEALIALIAFIWPESARGHFIIYFMESLFKAVVTVG